MAASGSLWNVNSWHWEEKNYTTWAIEKISALLHEWGVEVAPSNEKIVLTQAKPEGEASVSVRKGKCIAAYDFTITVQWKVGDINGNMKISDFSSGSVEDDDYDIQWFVASSGDTADATKEWLRRIGTTKLRDHMKVFHSEIKAKESEQEKIRKNVERRKEEESKTTEAQAVSGERKQQLLEETKAADIEKRAQTDSPQKVTAGDGSASQWNVNAWQWEELQKTKWAKETLEAQLSTFKTSLLDGTITLELLDPAIDGEASQSVRKGKKLIQFDLKVSAVWKATRRDADGKFLADAKGALLTEDFSSENLDDYLLKVVCDSESPPCVSINDVMRSEGVSKVREALASFVETFRET